MSKGGVIMDERCPYCGANRSRQLFIGFGGGFGGWGLGWGWHPWGHHGWGHHGWGWGWGGHGWHRSDEE